MRIRRLRAVVVVIGLGFAVAACGGSNGSTTTSAPHGATTSSTTGSSTTASTQNSTTSSSSSASTATTSQAGSTTSTSVAAGDDVVNEPVTDKVRTQLIAAGAASHGLTPADYTGLVPGETYYGYDVTTGTYWAGAALLPSSSSTQAQVSNQDDGAYLLFKRSANGDWMAMDVGLGDVGGGICPETPPTALAKLWNWPAGDCRPATLT